MGVDEAGNYWGARTNKTELQCLESWRNCQSTQSKEIPGRK